MELRACPVCAASLPATELEDHVETIHPTVRDPEVTEAQAAATHACPFCQTRLHTPEELKDHIASHGK